MQVELDDVLQTGEFSYSATNKVKVYLTITLPLSESWAGTGTTTRNLNDDIAMLGSADSGTVSSWAGEAMEWAVGAGLIGGRDVQSADGSISRVLDAGGNATRTEVAIVLQRLVNLMAG